MRISDWSSDVCSSDLLAAAAVRPEAPAPPPAGSPSCARPSGAGCKRFIGTMVARKAPRCGCGARPREAQRFAGAGIPGPGITPHCRRACQYRHERAETNDMTGKFKNGDHVAWNSEAGRVHEIGRTRCGERGGQNVKNRVVAVTITK